MAFESLTDEKIQQLLNSPKQLSNPMSRSKNKDGHEQYNFRATSTDGTGHVFEIYKRQNLREGMEDDFSCGISWVASNGETLTLKRYNGSSHNHPNQIEQTRVGYNCHIHIATERYIKANKKAEGFAEASTRYNSIDGAFHCLVTDCNISGITTKPDNANQTKLFD